MHSDRKATLEVEFQDEKGTGHSLEFYALVAAEIQRRDFELRICDYIVNLTVETSPNRLGAADAGSKRVKPSSYYVLKPTGLFPAPLPLDSPVCDHSEQVHWFLGAPVQTI